MIILNDIKSYLNITDSTKDNQLAGYINSSIAEVEKYCDRKLKYKTYTEYLDGDGDCVIYVPAYPVISVTSLKYYDEETEDYEDILDSGDTIADYVEVFDNQIRLLSGYSFPAGDKNIQLVYVAGYKCITGTGTVSGTVATKSITGVSTLFNTEVTAGDTIQIEGFDYEVASVTNNTSLTLTDNLNATVSAKNYVIKSTPPDLKQVLLEKVAIKYFDSFKGRLGVASENVGAQASQSYTFKDVNHSATLDRYKRYTA